MRRFCNKLGKKLIGNNSWKNFLEKKINQNLFYNVRMRNYLLHFLMYIFYHQNMTGTLY